MYHVQCPSVNYLQSMTVTAQNNRTCTPSLPPQYRAHPYHSDPSYYKLQLLFLPTPGNLERPLGIERRGHCIRNPIKRYHVEVLGDAWDMENTSGLTQSQ